MLHGFYCVFHLRFLRLKVIDKNSFDCCFCNALWTSTLCGSWALYKSYLLLSLLLFCTNCTRWFSFSSISCKGCLSLKMIAAHLKFVPGAKQMICRPCFLCPIFAIWRQATLLKSFGPWGKTDDLSALLVLCLSLPECLHFSFGSEDHLSLVQNRPVMPSIEFGGNASFCSTP